MKNLEKLVLTIPRQLIKHGYYHSTKCHQPTNIRKSVYISKSTNIFTNLAIEDWLYKNFNFSNHQILMLWQNNPCVVIGRHQNPWLECNFAELPYVTSHGVQLARRNSGGGTVFHDLGNLNLTFFTSRDSYNRKVNLELISRALNENFDLNIQISPREDLVIGDKKISGTASKLGRTSAYHHCTLLINANKEHLSKALKSTIGDIKTTATKSVKSKIMNIADENEEICVDKAMEIIACEYTDQSSFQPVFVEGEEIFFPDIGEIKKQYRSYEWRFEKTPKFKVCRTIQDSDKKLCLEIQLEIDKGAASDVHFFKSNVPDTNSEYKDIFSNLLGKNFSQELLREFEMLIEGVKYSDMFIKGRL